MPESIEQAAIPSRFIPFTSLEELRAYHSVLLQRKNSSAASRPTSSELGEFLTRASQLGRILQKSDAREDAQGIIDFWTANYLSNPISAQESLRSFVLDEFQESALSQTAVKLVEVTKNVEATAQRGDALIAQIDNKQKALLGTLLVRFVMLKESSLEEYAIPVAESDDFPPNNPAKALLSRLIGLGLVIKSGSGEGSSSYALAYHQLLRKWSFLNELVARRRAFREMARAWNRSNRPLGGLLNSSEQLDLALAFPGLTRIEDEFFDDSRKRNEATKRYQWAAVAALALILSLSVATVGLWSAWATTDRAKDEAVKAKDELLKAIERGKCMRNGEVAFSLSGARLEPEKSFLFAKVVALGALPSSSKGLAPPRALAVIRFVSSYDDEKFEKLRILQPGETLQLFDPIGKIATEIDNISRYLPWALSLDGKRLVTLEEGTTSNFRKPVVWDMEKLGEYTCDLPEIEREFDAVGFADTGEFVASGGGKMIAWNLDKKTIRDVTDHRIEDLVVPNTYIQKCPEGTFSPYAQIRDKWVYEALTKLEPLTDEQVRKLPPGLARFDVRKITEAFEMAESGTVDEAVSALNAALKKSVSTSDSFALQAIQWRLLDQGHLRMQSGNKTGADELYAKADAISKRPGKVENLLADDDLKFNNYFTEGLKAVQAGKFEDAKIHFKSAKEVGRDRLWAAQVRQWKLPDGQEGTPGEIVTAVRFNAPFGTGMSLSQKGDSAAGAEEFKNAKAIDEALWGINIKPWLNRDQASPEEFAVAVSFLTPFNEGFRAAKSGNRDSALKQFEIARNLSPDLWRNNVREFKLPGDATEVQLFQKIVGELPPTEPMKRE